MRAFSSFNSGACSFVGVLDVGRLKCRMSQIPSNMITAESPEFHRMNVIAGEDKRLVMRIKSCRAPIAFGFYRFCDVAFQWRIMGVYERL